MAPPVGIENVIAATVGPFIGIGLTSLMKEPNRQHLCAVILGMAAGSYLMGGFGVYEVPFTIAVCYCAYRGVTSYNFIAIGWLIHACLDLLHHLADDPVFDYYPASSFECVIVDVIWAGWFFLGAPTLHLFASRKKADL